MRGSDPLHVCAVLAPAPMTSPGGWGLPRLFLRISPGASVVPEYPQKRAGGGQRLVFLQLEIPVTCCSVILNKNHPKSQDQTNRSFTQRLKTEQLAGAGQRGLGRDAEPQVQSPRAAEGEQSVLGSHHSRPGAPHISSTGLRSRPPLWAAMRALGRGWPLEKWTAPGDTGHLEGVEGALH